MERDRFPVVVHVLLLRRTGARQELFLLRRAGTGFMDGFHVLPGGHQQSGESLLAAARRECLEETTVRADLAPLCVLPYRSGGHQGVNFVFLGQQWRGQPGIGEPDCCDAAGWYPLTELPEPAAPWLADVLELRARGEWFRELHWP